MSVLGACLRNAITGKGSIYKGKNGKEESLEFHRIDTKRGSSSLSKGGPREKRKGGGLHLQRP